MANKTLQEFQSYLNRYKEALLKLIPVYHNKGFIHYDISSYIKNIPERMKLVSSEIKSIKSKIKEFKKELSSCKKKKDERLTKAINCLKEELAISNEQLDTLKLNEEQAKKFQKVNSGVQDELKIVIESLDDIADKKTIDPFRYQFTEIFGDTDFKLEGNTGEKMGAIIIDFLSSLDKEKKTGLATVRKNILKKMGNKEKEFLEEYGDKLKAKVGDKKAKQTGGKLQRGKKQKNITDPEFIPYVKKNLLFLRSDSGGNLKGNDLHKRMQKDLIKRFDKYGGKAKLETGTIKNLISEIETGKHDTVKK